VFRTDRPKTSAAKSGIELRPPAADASASATEKTPATRTTSPLLRR
jgi:hypothetical protein